MCNIVYHSLICQCWVSMHDFKCFWGKESFHSSLTTRASSQGSKPFFWGWLQRLSPGVHNTLHSGLFRCNLNFLQLKNLMEYNDQCSVVHGHYGTLTLWVSSRGWEGEPYVPPFSRMWIYHLAFLFFPTEQPMDWRVFTQGMVPDGQYIYTDHLLALNSFTSQPPHH